MADRSPLAIFAIRTSSAIVCIAAAPALFIRQPARRQVQRKSEKDSSLISLAHFTGPFQGQSDRLPGTDWRSVGFRPDLRKLVRLSEPFDYLLRDPRRPRFARRRPA